MLEEEVGENEESQNAVEPEEDDPWARSSQSRDTHQGWQSSSGAWDQWWGYDAWSQTAWHSDDADWRTEAPEILPDMIQGWYLLGELRPGHWRAQHDPRSHQAGLQL